MSYKIVIGLEVHVQLLTRTKLFCGCSTEFGLPPNSATCPVCLGLPGTLPVMNKKAFDLSLKAALALNCTIAPFTKWDRKNYFYPDLPKNYQISQYDLPFSSEGFLEIDTSAGPKRIRIIRVHLEEDAGKMLHDEKGGGTESLVDLNRTGTPLLEIVSYPDISTPEETRSYLEEIRLLLRELGISDCEMQEGSLRCDANINLHITSSPPSEGGAGGGVATPIIEVKNLNSIAAVERAMRYEAERQFEEFQRTGQKMGDVPKATAGWDDERRVTRIQRRKEEASDYRYFPEPDLVPITVSDDRIAGMRADLGELPAIQRDRLPREYGLSPYDSSVLTRQGRAFVAYFEDVARRSGDAKEASNWMTNEVLQALNDQKQDIQSFAVSSTSLSELIQEVKATGLNKQRAREVFAEMMSSSQPAKEVIARLGFKAVTDTNQLREFVRKAIAANPKAVADYKSGKTQAANRIKGAVMGETKGMAKPELVQQILEEELKNV